ncbi:MAG: hypothetical protein LBR82_01460 [Desulfovibrio sp.]|jgi:outer membrane protein OmpA-like peptidoglycan-associated protein|nr:hypothetical protein [Desulfovibrio sp.]
MERLRTLLFHRELLLLEQVRARLDSPDARAGDVGSVLAEALLLSSREDDRLKMAMEPLVDSIVKESLRGNPHEFSESLFPLMGPSIRKSIAESFHSMLESFSKSMEISFSWKGLRWRLESLRTGKPFSEVVLLHTLVYRVDAVYLIHSATGISLASVMDEGAQSGDSDLVSAMLTAIQDFVNDCLAYGKKEDLDFLRQGEYSLLVERRPAAYLACVVRGAPPADYRTQMRACLEYLVMEYAGQLANFKGDTGAFAAARPRLEKLLGSRYVDEDKPLPVWIKLLVAALIAACPGGAAYIFYRHHTNTVRAAEEAERRRSFRADMLASVDLLRREPGLLVIHVAEQPSVEISSPADPASSSDSSGQHPDAPLKNASGEVSTPQTSATSADSAASKVSTDSASSSDSSGQGPDVPLENASGEVSPPQTSATSADSATSKASTDSASSSDSSGQGPNVPLENASEEVSPPQTSATSADSAASKVSTDSASSSDSSGQGPNAPLENANDAVSPPAAPATPQTTRDQSGQGPDTPQEKSAGETSLPVSRSVGAPWAVVCLKDSLARTPEEVLREHGKDPSLFRFTLIPFISYEPDMVSKRVDLSIRPPENVSMRFDNGVIYLSGTAPMDWTIEARRKALALPGVKDVDIRELSDPRTAKLAAMIREVQGASVVFALGKDVPVLDDVPKLTRLVDTLADMERLAAEMGMAVNLTIFGHADTVGTVARNYEISQARAKVIAAMLYARGSAMPLAIYGLGADYALKSEGPDQSSRRIELRVHLSPAAGPELNFINP